MGLYFNASQTRHTVAVNVGYACQMFGLSIQKLTDLSRPIANIPYTKYRRLLLGERDITVEELATLYELLAIPPTTFMYPWKTADADSLLNTFFKPAIKKTFAEEEAHPFWENPIFDYFGKSVYPYRFSDSGSWLAGQAICDTTSSSSNLYDLAQTEDKRDLFNLLLRDSLTDYFAESFPVEDCQKAFSPIISAIPVINRNPKDHELTDYLQKLTKATLCYSRLAAFNNFVTKTSSNTDSITGSVINKDAYAIWIAFTSINRIRQEQAFAMLLDYTQLTDTNLSYQITSIGQNTPDNLTIIARDHKDGHTLAHASIDFSYADWFQFRCPPVKPLHQKIRNSDLQNHVIAEGQLFPENYGNNLYNIQCFPILNPEFIR